MNPLRITVILLSLMGLQGLACIEREVPPELVQTTEKLRTAIQANADTRVIMFDAIAKNMKAQHEAQLKLFFDKRVLELQLERAKDGQGTDSVPVAPIEALFAKIKDYRDEFDNDIAAEREKWLNDPNLKIEAALAETTALYIQSIDNFAREMAKISALTKIQATKVGG